METKTLQPTREKQSFRRNLWSRKSEPIVTNKQFRLSDIDTKTRFLNLPHCNQLLFELNKIHNSFFNEQKPILKDHLTDELLKGLGTFFNVTPLSFEIEEDFIIVNSSLSFDIYDFDVKPFFKLKYKAPILFNAFIYFIKNSKISFLDNCKNKFLDEDCIQVFKDLIVDSETKKEKKEYRNAIKSIEKSKITIAFLLEEMQDDEGSIVKSLQNYKPKNKTYLLIKDAILKWLDYDFSFITQYPRQFYNEHINEEDEEDDDDYSDDLQVLEMYDRISFQYNSNTVVSDSINMERESFFNDCGEVASPCWIIGKEKEIDTSTRDSVRDFNFFSEEYFNIIDLLNVL